MTEQTYNIRLHGLQVSHYISREWKTTRNVLWSHASLCLSVCL